jgi:hypothetical protein
MVWSVWCGQSEKCVCCARCHRRRNTWTHNRAGPLPQSHPAPEDVEPLRVCPHSSGTCNHTRICHRCWEALHPRGVKRDPAVTSAVHPTTPSLSQPLPAAAAAAPPPPPQPPQPLPPSLPLLLSCSDHPDRACTKIEPRRANTTAVLIDATVHDQPLLSSDEFIVADTATAFTSQVHHAASLTSITTTTTAPSSPVIVTALASQLTSTILRHSSRESVPPERFVGDVWPRQEPSVIRLNDGDRVNGIFTFEHIIVASLRDYEKRDMGVPLVQSEYGVFARHALVAGEELDINGQVLKLTQTQLQKRIKKSTAYYLIHIRDDIYIDLSNDGDVPLPDDVVVARYVNHSSDAEEMNMRMDVDDENHPRLILTRHVDAGTQLLYNYNGGEQRKRYYVFEKEGALKGGNSPHHMDCACNSPCRKRTDDDILETGCEQARKRARTK